MYGDVPPVAEPLMVTVLPSIADAEDRVEVLVNLAKTFTENVLAADFPLLSLTITLMSYGSAAPGFTVTDVDVVSVVFAVHEEVDDFLK